MPRTVLFIDMVGEPQLDPNRLRVDDGNAADDVVVSASIEADATRVDVRRGVGTRTVEIPHNALSTVDYDRGLNFDLVLTADETTYRLTSVTASRSEVESIVDIVREARRERVGSVADGGSPDPEPAPSDLNPDPEPDRDSDLSSDPDPNAGSGPGGDTTAPDELRKWAQLRDEGVITEAEFEEKKAELLGD